MKRGGEQEGKTGPSNYMDIYFPSSLTHNLRATVEDI